MFKLIKFNFFSTLLTFCCALFCVDNHCTLAINLNLSEVCSENQIYFCTLNNLISTLDDPLVVIVTNTSSSPHLSELVLRNGLIPSLPRELFVQAPNLRSFFMHNCKLNRLNAYDFKQGHQLRKLVLQKNRLSDVPEKVFAAAFSLEVLQLGHNTIHMVHETAFYGLTNLKYLDMQENQIRRLPDRLFEDLINLEHIDLSSNEIEKIDSRTFAANVKLQTVLLSDNEFSVFEPNSLEHLPRLHLLDLSGSVLDELSVQSVDTLLLQNSKLKRCLISGGVVKMHAGNNQLTRINIGDKLSVREVEVHGNQLETLDDFVGMLNLQRLDVARNQLKSLSTSNSPLYLPLPSLVNLNLASNQLQNLSADNFLQLQKLTHLDLAFNHLLRLDVYIFEPLFNLEKFYIEGNRLHAFEYEIFFNSHEFLKELGMFDNEWEFRYMRKMIAFLRDHSIQLPVRFPSSNLHDTTAALESSSPSPLSTKATHHRYAATSYNELADNLNEAPTSAVQIKKIGITGIHPYWTMKDIFAVVTLLLVLIILLMQFYQIVREEQCFAWCLSRFRRIRNQAVATGRRRPQRLDEEDDSEV